MKKYKVFVACDGNNITKINKIIQETKNKKLEIGYKFGLEFLNSKKGREYVSKLRNEIKFGDYKILDIPNTCKSAIKSVKDLKFDYITIHISAGLNALKTQIYIIKINISTVKVLTYKNDIIFKYIIDYFVKA